MLFPNNCSGKAGLADGMAARPPRFLAHLASQGRLSKADQLAKVALEKDVDVRATMTISPPQKQRFPLSPA